MKYFRLRFEDGSFKIVEGKNSLEVIKKFDLASRKHINTTITELSGEQAAIARSNRGEVNLFSIVGIVYLGLLLIVLLTIF